MKEVELWSCGKQFGLGEVGNDTIRMSRRVAGRLQECGLELLLCLFRRSEQMFCDCQTVVITR